MKADASAYEAIGVLIPLWYSELAEVLLDDGALRLVFLETLPLSKLSECVRFSGETRLSDSALLEELPMKES